MNHPTFFSTKHFLQHMLLIFDDPTLAFLSFYLLFFQFFFVLTRFGYPKNLQKPKLKPGWRPSAAARRSATEPRWRGWRTPRCGCGCGARKWKNWWRDWQRWDPRRDPMGRGSQLRSVGKNGTLNVMYWKQIHWYIIVNWCQFRSWSLNIKIWSMVMFGQKNHGFGWIPPARWWRHVTTASNHRSRVLTS